MTDAKPVPEMRIEVVPVPVSDVDRAIRFYVDKIGFHLDHDRQTSETMRVVQLTPPGSACSIVIGTGLGDISEMKPGSVKSIHIVVKDVREVRDLLISRGVEVSDVVEYPRNVRFAYFSDPDGNSWALQDFPPDL